MAKETLTKLIDDLDGGEAHETVTFGLDGVHYEIDLSTKNATKLRSTLAPYVDNGERVRREVSRRGSVPKPRTTVAEREENQAIRAWALKNGFDAAPRGRIRQDILDAYNKRSGRRPRTAA